MNRLREKFTNDEFGLKFPITLLEHEKGFPLKGATSLSFLKYFVDLRKRSYGWMDEAKFLGLFWQNRAS